MEKIVSLLGRNSLRVNYFTFFIVSVLFNVLAVFLPYSVNLVVMQVLKFLMIFSIVMYVADQLKVVRVAFWCLLFYFGSNLFLGIAYSLFEVMQGVTLNLILGAVLSVFYLFILIGLLRHALPRMKSIVVSLFVLELYNMCKPLLYQLFSSISEASVRSELFLFCWNIIPFLLMLPLFILIARNGKGKWENPDLRR